MNMHYLALLLVWESQLYFWLLNYWHETTLVDKTIMKLANPYISMTNADVVNKKTIEWPLHLMKYRKLLKVNWFWLQESIPLGAWNLRWLSSNLRLLRGSSDSWPFNFRVSNVPLQKSASPNRNLEIIFQTSKPDWYWFMILFEFQRRLKSNFRDGLFTEKSRQKWFH